MIILNRIEERVALPGDSESTRSRKTLATLVLFGGALGSLLNAVTLLANDMTVNAALIVIYALSLVLGGIIVLAFPASYNVVAMVFLLATVVVNAAQQVLYGGFASGVFAVPWSILGVAGAVLFLGERFTLVSLVVFIAAMIIVGVLEPLAVTLGPEISMATRISINVPGMIILCLMIALSILYIFRQMERYRTRANDLLLNILPGSIATRLKESPETIADGYNEVTVLFADIVDFTEMSSGADPVKVVNLLNDIFSEFDELAQKHGLEKIKTIGDAYMVAAGLPEPRPDHTEAIVAFAIDMLDAVEQHEGFLGQPVRIRVGVNTGPVVAGVIGRQKFIYDLWGDAVNVASRMESNGLANQIQVTAAVKEKLEGQYTFAERAPIHIKGKGMMVTYLLQEPTNEVLIIKSK